MFKTNCKCPRCGGILYTQTEYGDYSYQCQNCDEDFYDFVDNLPECKKSDK